MQARALGVLGGHLFGQLLTHLHAVQLLSPLHAVVHAIRRLWSISLVVAARPLTY